MPSTVLGADADELERIAATLRHAADELDGHAGSVTSTLRSVAWVGGVASRFGSQWNGGHRPRIISTAQYVRDAAAQLDRNAVEQRETSAARRSTATGSGPPGGPSPGPTGGTTPASADAPGSPALDKIGELLSVLGVNRSVLEALAEHADILEGTSVDGLIDILTNDDFVKLLEGLDKALDVGDVVVNLVTDFVENPSLAFDERVVHAIADAATRFGIDQGVEYAANFLTQAATTALLPGLGAALAPFAGKAAGAIADAVMGQIIDAVDGATDFVDTVADAAVEAYRQIKNTFGVVLDAAGAVIDVADAALDLAGDAAGAVIDAGGAVIDVGGSVVGAINPFD